METKHTATPWTIQSAWECIMPCVTPCDTDDPEDREIRAQAQNALHFLRANAAALDACVEALTTLIVARINYLDPLKFYDAVETGMVQARAAVEAAKKARG